MPMRLVAALAAATISYASAQECGALGNCSAQGTAFVQRGIIKTTSRIQQDPPATYDTKGTGVAAWASEYASLRNQRLTSGQITEFNNAVKDHTCVKTQAARPDRCKPDSDGCESGGSSARRRSSGTISDAQSRCKSQPTATISTKSGGVKVVDFRGQCHRGKSSSCYGAHSCTAGLLETEPVYLQACGAFTFDWKAEGGSDWYQVIIAIKKDGNIVRTEIYRGKKMSQYKTGNVWVSQEMGSGWYSVAFYTASYDRTNGMALGAKLYVKPFHYENFVRGNAADGCDIPEPVPTPSPTESPTPAPTDEFQSIDTNDDGCIDRNEWDAFKSAASAPIRGFTTTPTTHGD